MEVYWVIKEGGIVMFIGLFDLFNLLVSFVVNIWMFFFKDEEYCDWFK